MRFDQPYVSANWFGLASHNTAQQNHDALQKAVKHARDDDKELRIDGGVYEIDGPLIIDGAKALVMRGNGSSAVEGGTEFLWRGSPWQEPGKPSVLFSFINPRECTLSDFSVKTGHNPLGTAIEWVSAYDPGVAVPTNNRCYRIVLDGNNGSMNRGFVTRCVGKDYNNDLNLWESCSVINYGHAVAAGSPYGDLGAAGWSFEHSQSKSNLLLKCGANASGYMDGPAGKYGVSTNLGGNVAKGWGQGGTFHWQDGGGGHCEVFFDIGGGNDGINISGMWTLENCRGLIRQRLSNSTMPINIFGGRFAANVMEDGDILIDLRTPGPLNVTGMFMGSNNRNQADVLPIWLGYEHPKLLTFPMATILGNVFRTNHANMIEGLDNLNVFARNNVMGARDEDVRMAPNEDKVVAA